jgi:hypothetical protein
VTRVSTRTRHRAGEDGPRTARRSPGSVAGEGVSFLAAVSKLAALANLKGLRCQEVHDREQQLSRLEIDGEQQAPRRELDPMVEFEVRAHLGDTRGLLLRGGCRHDPRAHAFAQVRPVDVNQFAKKHRDLICAT